MTIISTHATGPNDRRWHHVPTDRNALLELELWQAEHKARSVDVSHDDGYGAGSWGVALRQGSDALTVVEWTNYDPTEPPPALAGHLYVCHNEADPEVIGDDWVGLKATILAAVDEARRRWG